jgi:N-acetylmuramoyl-L-alanine amidase
LGSRPVPHGDKELTGTAEIAQAQWYPSPNFGERRDGLRPTLVVIHYTAMDSALAALERLCDPAVEVSAHYLIGGDGTLWQLVAEEQRAWHAGAGEWLGQDDINSRSIGIELDNRGDHPFAEPQMRMLEHLLADIMRRWKVPAGGVIGHSDMAPGRKFDPGARFDWPRLERLGLAASPQARDGANFPDLARSAGFTAAAEADALLDAVRLRLRSTGRGPLCAADIAALKRGSA